MPRIQSGKYTFDTPQAYRIRVQGSLDAYWAERMGGMHITTIKRGDRKLETTLVGRMADQAALVGILNTLYDLHLSLISVEPINDE